MTPEQEQAIRARHVRVEDPTYIEPICGDDELRWPCDAATLLAALDEARAAFADAAAYERAKVADMMTQRDAARADADRLAEALRVSHQHSEQATDRARAALAALAAAEAERDEAIEALRTLTHQDDGTPNTLRDDFPDGGDIVLRWPGNSTDWQHALDMVVAHDARRDDYIKSMGGEGRCRAGRTERKKKSPPL